MLSLIEINTNGAFPYKAVRKPGRVIYILEGVGHFMLELSTFKSLLRKNKKFKIVELKNWKDELEEDIDFIYFTYNVTDTNFEHIMLVILYLEDKVEYEFIHQLHENSEIEQFKGSVLQLLHSTIEKNGDIHSVPMVQGLDKERFKKYILSDEKLKKKMERYIKS